MSDTCRMPFVRQLLLYFLICFCSGAFAQERSDSAQNQRILIIPYQPGMHLPDPADLDIAMASGVQLDEMRKIFREALLKSLQSQIVSVYDASILQSDHVGDDDNDNELIYHAEYFQQDTIWPISKPKKDSLLKMKTFFHPKTKKPFAIEKTYMNVGFYDQQLLGDLARKYSADKFVVLNQFEIKTNFNDCMDLARKIYDREVRVHYSVFDRNGKQVHGDVAVSHFLSNSNDIDEIIRSNYPRISSYILASLRNN